MNDLPETNDMRDRIEMLCLDIFWLGKHNQQSRSEIKEGLDSMVLKSAMNIIVNLFDQQRKAAVLEVLERIDKKICEPASYEHGPLESAQKRIANGLNEIRSISQELTSPNG